MGVLDNTVLDVGRSRAGDACIRLWLRAGSSSASHCRLGLGVDTERDERGVFVSDAMRESSFKSVEKGRPNASPFSAVFSIENGLK